MLDRISFDDDQLILDTRSIDMTEVFAFLKMHGCRSPEKLEPFGTDLFLSVPSAWDDSFVPFFPSAEVMWHAVKTRSKKPEKIYIIGMDKAQQNSVLQLIDLYFLIREMLKALCHSEGDDRQACKYIFFSSKESVLTRLEIPYLIVFNDLMDIRLEETNLKDAQKMHAAVMAEEDVHCEERRHVMREAITDFLKHDKDRSLHFIMTSVSKLYKIYNERYKIYVSKFSVNKILTEIESDCVNFLCKIQDAIMAQQTKAFAVPGGIVAVGAILKPATTPWDYLIIIIGLIISTWMIVSLNNNVETHIDLLVEEFDRSTKKYDDIVTGVQEIHEKVENSHEKLSSFSESAKSKLSFLTNICCLVFVLVAVVLLKRYLTTS